jgi:hypothetical protein
LIAAQPLSGVIALSLLAGGLPFFTSLNARGAAGLGHARQDCEHQREAGGRYLHFRRDGFEF